MADIRRTDVPPSSTNIQAESRSSGGMGVILFILGGVIALLAVLWFAQTPDRDATPAPIVQEKGDVNTTIEAPAPTAPNPVPEPPVPADPVPDSPSPADPVTPQPEATTPPATNN